MTVGAVSLCCQWNQHSMVRADRLLLWALESTKELWMRVPMEYSTVKTLEGISLDVQSWKSTGALPR